MTSEEYKKFHEQQQRDQLTVRGLAVALTELYSRALNAGQSDPSFRTEICDTVKDRATECPRNMLPEIIESQLAAIAAHVEPTVPEGLAQAARRFTLLGAVLSEGQIDPNFAVAAVDLFLDMPKSGTNTVEDLLSSLSIPK